jgi:hypothetical protein
MVQGAEPHCSKSFTKWLSSSLINVLKPTPVEGLTGPEPVTGPNWLVFTKKIHKF